MERAVLSIFTLAFFGLLFLSGCQERKEPPRVFFRPWGMEVKGLAPGARLRLYDAQKNLLLAYPSLWGENQRLFFPWKPGEKYLLEYREKFFSFKAPSSRIEASLEVFAPLGQPPFRAWFYKKGGIIWENPPPAEGFSLVGEGSCFEVGFLVTSFTKNLSTQIGKTTFSLSPYERRLEKLTLCFGSGKENKIAVVLGGKELSLSFRWEKRSLRGAVRLLSWDLPTDAYGYREKHRLPDTLVAPNPFWEKLAHRLGIKAKGFSRYDPFAYQCLLLENRFPSPLTLLVKGAFLDPATRRPVRGFYPPRFSSHGQFKEPVALVSLPARGEAKAVLPVFLSQDIPPGEYLARIEIYSFGAESPLLVKEKRFGVVRGSPLLSGALLLVLFLGGGYALVLLFWLRRLLQRFPLRELALLALTGAVGFGLDFLGGLLSNILYALLGPFNILVGGLVTEVAHYLVLTAVLWLLPKPGVVTLAGLITYFMGCILFGGFRFTDPFFLGARLLVLESFVALANWVGGRALSLVLMLALADAVNTAISLLLHMTFFRLFFPGWYIWLSILVKGFLYTLVGATLGVRVGKLLKRVER